MKIPTINMDAVQLAVSSIATQGADSDKVLKLQDALKTSMTRMVEQCQQEKWGNDCQEQLNSILEQIHALSRDLLVTEQQTASRKLDLQAFPVALWAIRKGAIVENPGPVVHAVAQLANQLSKPDDLQKLFALVDEIYAAIAPAIRDDKGIQESGRPWRLLLLNRAIIATRSLQPALMETAFDSLVHYLPGDLNGFLKEGIRQLDVIGYPEPVRQVMESYYTQYGTPATLH